jgi:hypothetical protein
MVAAEIIQSKGGKVRLLKPNELPKVWDPTKDHRLTVWEMVHHLIRALDKGESAAAELVAKLGSRPICWTMLRASSRLISSAPKAAANDSGFCTRGSVFIVCAEVS